MHVASLVTRQQNAPNGPKRLKRRIKKNILLNLLLPLFPVVP
jgi:hypothetical protein